MEKKAGRPPIPEAKRKVTVTITVTPADLEALRALGDGNISAGVAAALASKGRKPAWKPEPQSTS